MRTAKLAVIVLILLPLLGCHARVVVQTAPPPEPHAVPAPPPQPHATPAPAPEPHAVPAPAPEPHATPAPAPSGPEGPQACTSSATCPQGTTCQGAEGCTAAWTCQSERRACTLDLVPFCGCDGTTFSSSSTCPSRPYLHRGPCQTPPRAPQAPAPQGQVQAPPRPTPPPQAGQCVTSSDCPQGQMCLHSEGCGAVSTCGPSRPCTRDLVPFCGCDGQTFRGSSSCPPRPFAHRGACRPSDGPVPQPGARPGQ